MSEHRFMSQHGEDRWILENLNPPKTGFFIEIGAYNGYNCSNTLGFEDMGWHGICVEPDPIMAAECMKLRKCQTLCAAIGLSLVGVGPVAFFVNTEDRGLSCLHWKKSNCVAGETSILVPVLSLENLIMSCPNFQCDLLSIDTEGTELEVWHSGRGVRPRIVIMEYQTSEEPSQETPIIERMTKDGYAAVHKTPHNLIFAR